MSTKAESKSARLQELIHRRDKVLAQPYEVEAGKLHIPDVPGVGLEWDEKAVAAHLAESF